MKKLFAILWICLLCAGLLIYSFLDRPCAPCTPEVPASEAASSEPSDAWVSSEPSDASVPSASLEPTEPSEVTEPSEEATSPSEPEASETQPSESQPSETQPSEPEISEPTEPGLVQIRLQVSDPAAWQPLAGVYPELGLELIISDEAPTLMLFDTAQEVRAASDTLLDLTNTAAYAQLIDWDLAAKAGGKVCGLPMEMDCFGLICNNGFMATLGATTGDITDFTKLAQVAANITNKGVPAFATMDMEALARMIGSIPADSRVFLDLYLQNNGSHANAASDTGLQEMLDQQAVFCLGYASDLAELNSLGEHQLGILPIYLGGENDANSSLCVTPGSYLCVSAAATEQEQQAAVAFLNALVVAGADGLVPVDTLGISAPYRQATYTANDFEQLLRSDLLAGKGCIPCRDLSVVPAGLTEALLSYAAAPTDENWTAIQNCLDAANG